MSKEMDIIIAPAEKEETVPAPAAEVVEAAAETVEAPVEAPVEAAPAAPVEEPVRKKRPGRKPMTPEEKEASRKRREEEKRLAAALKPEVYVQFQETEADIAVLIERAKEEFHKEKKRTRITGMKLYIKPEERAAYYVINEKASGKVEY